MRPFSEAVRNGDIEYVRAHFRKYKISKEELNSALNTSAKNGYLTLVKFLSRRKK